MMRHVFRPAAAAVALLAAVPCAAQKSGDARNMGPLEVSTTTDRPLRATYRAAIAAAQEMGFPLRMMLLDRGLLTMPHVMQEGQAPTFMQVQFEPRGDSVRFSVVSVAIDPSGRERCTTDLCLAAELAASAMFSKGVTDRLKTYQPPARTAGDSLAEARAFGYAPENPVKVGGGRESGVQNEHAWLTALRGPNGQAVTWFRLGSCCAFETPNAPPDMQGHGLLDAYEVSYPGLPHPVLLYLDLYDSADGQVVPAGFTRPAAPVPST